MKLSSWAIVALTIGSVGCETAHNVGRTLTSPVRYVFHEPEPTPTTNTSDVTNPGRPVATPSPTARPGVAARKSMEQSPGGPPRAGGKNPPGKPAPTPQRYAGTHTFRREKPS